MVLFLSAKEVGYRYANVLEVHTAVSYSLIPQFSFVHRPCSGNRDSMSSIMVKEGNITFP